MKNKYHTIFFILSLGTGLVCSNLLDSVNAQSFNSNVQKKYNYSKRYRKIYSLGKNKDQINKSFYKHGYTFEESLKPKNKFLDLFGISSKSKHSFFSFPEQRIESDSFIFWKTYKNLLLDQIPKKPKFTKDINNGFNTSLNR